MQISPVYTAGVGDVDSKRVIFEKKQKINTITLGYWIEVPKIG